MGSLAERLAAWSMFSVAVALLPFIANAYKLADRGIEVTLTLLFGNGELLLVAAVVSAAALGEIVLAEVPRVKRTAKILTTGGAILLFGVCAMRYADVSTLLKQPPLSTPVASPEATTSTPTQAATALATQYNTDGVAQGSIVLFLLTIVVSASCLYVSHDRVSK